MAPPSCRPRAAASSTRTPSDCCRRTGEPRGRRGLWHSSLARGSLAENVELEVAFRDRAEDRVAAVVRECRRRAYVRVRVRVVGARIPDFARRVGVRVRVRNVALACVGEDGTAIVLFVVRHRAPAHLVLPKRHRAQVGVTAVLPRVGHLLLLRAVCNVLPCKLRKRGGGVLCADDSMVAHHPTLAHELHRLPFHGSARPPSRSSVGMSWAARGGDGTHKMLAGRQRMCCLPARSRGFVPFSRMSFFGFGREHVS